MLILILIFSIVYIWFKEHHKLEEMKEASHKISCLRQNIHDIYVRAVDLSLIGETILNWDDEDIELYHTKRLEVDTLLYQFSSVCRACAKPHAHNGGQIPSRLPPGRVPI